MGIIFAPHADTAVQVELYDHEEDPNEHVNVAAEHPEMVQRLIGRLRKFAVQ